MKAQIQKSLHFAMALSLALALFVARPTYAVDGKINRNHSCATQFFEIEKTDAPKDLPGTTANIARSAEPEINSVTDASFRYAMYAKLMAQASYRKASAFAKTANRYINPSFKVLPVAAGDTWTTKAQAIFGSTLRGIYNDGLRFLSPIPLPEILHPVNQIFARLWKNPKYIATAEDLALLERYGATEQFHERQSFLLSHPRWRQTHRVIAAGLGGAMVTTTLLAVAQANEMAEHTYSASEFLALPSEQNDGAPIVQLLIETTPFPHTSLRIGDTVYSYGYTNLTAGTLANFLANMLDPSKTTTTATTPDMPFKDGAESQGGAAVSVTVAMGHITTRLAKNAPRSIRVVEIHLPINEISNLRKDLESKLGMTYANQVMINDCSTMVVRALERNTSIRIPAIIDPYPTISAEVISAYLAVRSQLGDADVGKTMMIVPDGTKSHLSFLVRNTFIATIEERLFLANLAVPITPIQRTWLDVFNDDSDLEYYDPEVQKTLQAWRASAASDLKLQLNGYFGDTDFFAKIGQMPSSPEKTNKQDEARKVVNEMIDKKIQDINETLNSPYVTLRDIVEGQSKLDTLENVRRLWLTQINGKS